MIGQSQELSRLSKENLEEAREQLLTAIANYNAVIADEVVCVFDAYEQAGALSNLISLTIYLIHH